MAFKNQLLARLFGQEEPAPQEEQPEQLPPPSEEPSPVLRHELQLPAEHALHQLWKLRKEQSGWLPQPALFLEGTEAEDRLPDDEARRELFRLQMVVSSTAKERLNRIRPKKAKGETKKKEAPQHPPPVPDLDAQAVVLTSASGLYAWLLLYPPVGGGRELTRGNLERALREKQVLFGVDEAALDALSQDPGRYFCLFPVARGKPAIHGLDGRIVDMYPRTVERTVTIDEHNRVDYMSLNFVQNVGEGEVICRSIPPTQGTPGRTVLDQEIPAKAGRAAPLPKGRNTKVSEDGGALLATIAGHVEFSGRSFQVKPLLEISGNVDYSTGNINFLGDVCIHGDICSGFTVRAMGNITVDGVVEACTVEAGGDLVVARGVQGDNQAIIRSQRNIFAKYLENSCICVKESLQTDCIINCDVYCDGAVMVRSGRMTVIGSRIRAAHEVSAGIVGSRTEFRTDIILGGQPCGEYDYDVLTREIGQMQAELEATECRPDSPDKLSRMSKLRMQLMVNQNKLAQLDKERELLAREQEPGLRRMVCDTVYPGTVLTIGEVSYRFDRKVFPCNASLVQGEISLA